MTLLNCATTGRLMISPPPMYAGGYTSTVDHAVVCKQRGFIDQRHNELRDLEAELLSSVCSDVRMEPILQDISGEQLSRGTNSAPDARLDIHARGFWERQRAALFDVRVCHPNANSYRKMESQQVDRIRENEKSRQYSRRVLDVEQGTFTPLVLRQRVEWGKEFLKSHCRLAELFASNKEVQYSTAISWVSARFVCAFAISSCLFKRLQEHWESSVSH